MLVFKKQALLLIYARFAVASIRNISNYTAYFLDAYAKVFIFLYVTYLIPNVESLQLI